MALRSPKTQSLLALGGIVVAIGVGLWRGFSSENEGRIGFALWTMVPMFLIAVAALVHAYSRDELAGWLKPEWGDITRGFVVGLLLFAGAFVFVKIVIPPGSPHEAWMARIYLSLGDPSRLREHMVGAAIAIVIASAIEEIVWRGLVFDLVSNVIGPRRAWIVAGLLYALAHVGTVISLADPSAGHNPMLMFAALGCGLVWSFMRRLFGRIPPSIVAHALFDWTVVMMFRLWGPSV